MGVCSIKCAACWALFLPLADDLLKPRRMGFINSSRFFFLGLSMITNCHPDRCSSHLFISAHSSAWHLQNVQYLSFVCLARNRKDFSLLGLLPWNYEECCLSLVPVRLLKRSPWMTQVPKGLSQLLAEVGIANPFLNSRVNSLVTWHGWIKILSVSANQGLGNSYVRKLTVSEDLIQSQLEERE